MMVSHSPSHTGACLSLSRYVGRQPSTGNIDITVPTLSTPAIDASPPNEASRLTVEMPSPLSESLLGLTGFPSVTHELNTLGLLGIVDQQIGTQATNRRRRASHSPSSRSRSRPLSPLPEDPLSPEDPLNLDIQVLLEPAPFQSTNRRERKPTRPSSFQPFRLLRPIIRPTKCWFFVGAEYAKYKWIQTATAVRL